jgi:hypothetical protein
MMCYECEPKVNGITYATGRLYYILKVNSLTVPINPCFRVNVGLYSINSLRQRPFTSLGSYLNNSLTVINDWDQPNNRCTQLVTMSLNFFDRNLLRF